jgi:hypothetical protein
MPFDLEGYRKNLEGMQGLTPEQQTFALGRMYPAGDDEGKFFQDYLNYAERQNTPEAMREKLKVQNEFDRERMKAAAPYKLLFDIPGQITQAFTLPGQLAMEGANRVANTVMEGVRALPAPQVVARSAQYTPTSYFGRG